MGNDIGIDGAATETIPRAPGGRPVMGHTWNLLRNPQGFLDSLPADGELMEVRFGKIRTVLVCDAELTRQVLRDDRTFDKGGLLWDSARREVVGNTLAACPRALHRRQRRLTQPAFHRSRLRDYVATMAVHTTAACDSWREGQVLDVIPEMQKISLQNLTSALLGRALSQESLAIITRDVNTILANIYRRALIPPLVKRIPTLGNLRYKQAQDRLRSSVNDFIAERRDGIDRGDLLSALLAARDPEGDCDQGFTDAEARDQAFTFFIAGTETTATTLAWTLHLLARHPAVQARLHAEVDSVVGTGPVDLDHLDRLEFTGRVVTESLRLCPPPWFLSRITTSDTRLGRYHLPAGTTVFFSSYLLHRRNGLYDFPARFDPDRWDPASPQPARAAYIPFGAGPRKCIGDEFGRTEAILVLATIAARWRLDHPPGADVRPKMALTFHPARLRLRATRRTGTP
ncbi:cytochrome P450 [Spirillospora sp. NPDC029432]|uniref:cytochrome P450 n=1 Tax=Spirillospora sp. NPDC029432 TaxID=3154599 RepID=UPI00345199B3